VGSLQEKLNELNMFAVSGFTDLRRQLCNPAIVHEDQGITPIKIQLSPA
jgi:hypothetical protein